tara:strand:+ start:123 stop:614 length:492 start_codon:yes stop_codon:yes gene_type:complete
MNRLLTHSLAVFGLIGSMIALINLQGCENNEETVTNKTVDVYTTQDSQSYNDLSEYLDSVATAYDIDVEVVYDEETVDVVSTTVGDTVYEDVIVIEAETFGQAFSSARYQLGANQEFVWKANGITYTTNFSEELEDKIISTPSHYWTDAEINSGTVGDSTKTP